MFNLAPLDPRLTGVVHAVLIICDLGLKEVTKEQVIVSLTARLHFLSCLLTDLSLIPRGTALSPCSDIFPIGKTDFSYRPLK